MKDRIENKSFTETGSHFSDAIVVTDADGLIEWINHAFHVPCGYLKKEVLGRRPGDFLRGENTNPEAVRALHDAGVNRTRSPALAVPKLGPKRDSADRFCGCCVVASPPVKYEEPHKRIATERHFLSC